MKPFVKICLSCVLLSAVLHSQVPTTLEDFFMPGSQPLESGDLATPASCSCHDFDPDVDAMFGWDGSMMSKAMRDQLFVATMSVALQDADSSADLCLRCHTPTGWLSGRSEPPDGSALIEEDYTGVNCLFCHRMIAPSEPGMNPFPDDDLYMDPDIGSNSTSTYHADSTYIADFISAHIPPASANGMFVVTNEDERRGPYSDAANPNHGFYYSPFHQSSDHCGTCHDVSNPAYNRSGTSDYTLNDLNESAPDFSPYAMFPIERTFSEWKQSAYNTPEGISGTVFGGNRSTVSTCQDCHMADVTGRGTSRGNAPVREDLALHDLTGGNTFMPLVLQNQYPDLVNADALNAGIARATWMLQHAATMELSVEGNILSVKVQNETGHKLPSGYPEGRRIWIHVQAFDVNEQQIYESGAYDPDTGILTHDEDVRIYEIKPGLSPAIADILETTAGPSFHFVLNDTVYSDNRIPPRGFTNANFEAIQSAPVGHSYEDGQYWDITEYELPASRYSAIVTLYYQTTSKEYIEFLRDENTTDSEGQTMYDLWDQNGKSAPVVMVQESWEDISSAIAENTDLNVMVPETALIVRGPNPFNNQIHFEYTIAREGQAEINIYTIYGAKVGSLENRFHNKGSHVTTWGAGDHASGTYIVHLKTRNENIFRKIVLLK